MRTTDRSARSEAVPHKVMAGPGVSLRRGIAVPRRREGDEAAPGRPVSPVRWARWGGISRGLAATIAPRLPAVLVLSLPRSGSSWLGDTMGQAADALYLREPVTQNDATFYRLGTVFHPDRAGAEVETTYRRLADKAFLGWPDYDHTIVRVPERWGLRQRRSRRVVIKEVNPLACGWYLGRYRPRVIHLVRHPVAVALSNQKKGWLTPDPHDWARYGAFQAMAIREQAEALAGYPASEAVTYESLCADPLRVFERLFAFAGLTWDGPIREFIQAQSARSREMIGSWRREVPPRTVEALRRGYSAAGLPWYRDDRDW